MRCKVAIATVLGGRPRDVRRRRGQSSRVPRVAVRRRSPTGLPGRPGAGKMTPARNGPRARITARVTVAVLILLEARPDHWAFTPSTRSWRRPRL
jgi:hypothetical protein